MAAPDEDAAPFAAPRPAALSRTMQVLLVGVIGAAFVGYVVGVGRPGKWGHSSFRLEGPPLESGGIERQGLPPPLPVPGEMRNVPISPALSYDELRRGRIGPNRLWRSDVRTLAAAAAPRVDATDTDPLLRQASLARRAGRRAYNGAPPVVPHAIEQRSDASCLACHEAGLRIAGATASVIPHARLTNCTQCHVEAGPPPLPGSPSAPGADGFRGLAAPSGGERAWPGAPPVVPHSTLMRSDCLACHGPAGLDGMRTTHPERRSCLQCHAPSAELDQRVPRVAGAAGAASAAGGTP